VRLADLDPSTLLITPTTAPLAALACHTVREQVANLTSATELIKADTDPDRGARLVGAAITLASIVLPKSAIITALREADMPVPVRDTPLGRMLFEEGRQEGQQEGRQAGRREAAEQITAALIRRRFGDDPRIPAVAARLAELPEDDSIAEISAATSLNDLADG
jgi:hypothetical protein